MSLFEPRKSLTSTPSNDDKKPFITPTVQQMAQRKDEQEGSQNESAFSKDSFISPTVIQRKPTTGHDQNGGQKENVESSSDEKQSTEHAESTETSTTIKTQKSTIDEGQEVPEDKGPIEYTFVFADKQRTISVNGSELIMGEFTPGEVLDFRVDGAYGGNPPVGYKDQSMGFKIMLLDIMKPEAGDKFTVYFKQYDGRTPVNITYTMGSIKSPSEPESSTNPGPRQAQGSESKSEEGVEESSGAPEASSGPYWTHGWRTDRFGNEVVFIWEVGGKRRYSNGDNGYEYIRKMAALLPGDTGYDPRFERYKKRPQVGEGSDAKLNFWVKRTPGWDNPDHADNGAADYSDLAEFKDTPTNRKGTGFYYMAYVFDPLIYEKLAGQKRQKENDQYVGNQTNYKGFVRAENGIILHDTPTPFDKAYASKQGKEEFIIPQNRPVTVIAEANEANEGWVMIRTASGEEGWIERRHISKEPTPQNDQIFDVYTVKEGDNLEGLIKSYYKNYPNSTGNDRRTVALAIYLYNKDKPGSGVYRNQSKYKDAGSWKDYVDPWMQETRANYQSVELYAGGDVILPPVEYIEKMRQLGELEKRPDFVNVMIESGRMVQGFIAGVGIGFWDALVGTGEDLYNMIVDIFTGEIFNQIADMFNMFMEKGLSGIWDMIKDFGIAKWEEVKAAWNNPNPYERGKYFGEIIGMILFEVVLALLTAGMANGIKASAKVQKVLKWFPNMNKKSMVPDNVDNYADDIRRANRDKDVDSKKDRTDDDRDKDNDSEENKGEDAKALLAAKVYVNQQDASEPSPDVEVVVGAINKMPGTKLSAGKKYKHRPNGLGEGHFEIFYNPPVKKDYTQGKSGSLNVSQAKRSIKDQLSRGKNASVTVSSKADAEELLRDLISGPDQKGSYMNTTPDGSFSPQADASDYLPRESSSKRGTYHWDEFDPNAKAGDHANIGAHLQIHQFDGKIIRIFY